jgi:hypothetical protein
MCRSRSLLLERPGSIARVADATSGLGRGPVSATELAEEMAQRRREDPEYRARAEQFEADLQARAMQEREASRPVLDDLRAIGVEVDSVWDLHTVPDVRSRAIPVLLTHIVREYPDRVLEGIGQGLDDKASRPWWDDLRAILLATDHPVVRDRVACALAACAAREHYGDLLTFIRDDSLGESKIYFLRPINRIGNRISDGEGRAVIESVTGDPVLGKEASAILKGRSPKE